MNTLAVIGGSSPFTVELFHQLALTELREQPYALSLHGRNFDALELVRYFAAATLPAWRILATPDLDEALADANIVVHQARYGGLEGRFQDELLAATLDTLVDETLGPGGLHIAVLLGHAPSITCTANISSSGDIAQERMVRLDRSKLTIKSPGQPPPLVAAWMDRFRRHEESVLTATRCRTRAAVIAALKLNPLIGCDQVPIAADLIDV
ncbi:putative glycoside hydrolase [Candidatus Paraburkholderia kirkii UZHbot1]|uniref:Putative glycoside hydrolase n=1 Tax=Candidatus Paraburkholderia kirkii UZHbot1 TaxID=1055526 RepID=G4M6D8_9BURK|nr:putative glycoside hydrolase [Candidatus Paraburkholderia kirkii UZHbot1]